MSIRTLSRVWEQSKHRGSELLMLLAIADFADDNGYAFPSVATLAKKCRTSPRNANLILRQLRESGELTVRFNDGPKGVNRYQIQAPRLEETFTPDESNTLNRSSLPTEDRFPLPPNAASDKPSVNHQEPSDRVARLEKGTRLPPNWRLPSEYGQWAVHELGWSVPRVREVADRFADYWHAASGPSALKADWLAAWRLWCRREKEPFIPQIAPRLTQHQQNQAGIASSLFGGQHNQYVDRPTEKEVYGEVVQ